MDAVIAAKSAAAFRQNFKFAPSAQRQAVRAFGKGVSCCAPTGQGTGNEHCFSALIQPFQLRSDFALDLHRIDGEASAR